MLLFNFSRACVNKQLINKQTRLDNIYRDFKTQKLLLKNKSFILPGVSGHQAPYSIPPSLSKLVLGVSLVLTYIELMFPFGTPGKHHKTLLANISTSDQR